MGELPELDWALGEVAVAPDEETREVRHRTTRCPDVVPASRLLRPGDEGFGDVLDLDMCEWCRRDWFGFEYDETPDQPG